MNKKLFYAEIETFKKKCINRLILTAILSTLVILLLIANIPDAANGLVRGSLFMGVVITIASYFGIIYSVVSDYTDKFVELSQKYKW